MGIAQPYRLFVPCAPGLEPELLADVRGLGGVRPKTSAGGVELEANDHVLYRCLLELGLALDVRVRLGSFPAHYFDAIAKGVAKLPWGRFIGAGQTVEVRATARRSKLQHTGAIEERVFEGIKRVMGSFATDDPEPWRVFARLERDQLSLSLSLAGAPLSKRGYRLATAKAPLREDLALAILRLSGWTPERPLVDPFCGSGTVLLEAARWARGIPPGWDRGFHVERAPTFDAERWAKVRSSAEAKMRDAPATIRGSDRDAGAIRAAQENAGRAGVEDSISLELAPMGSTSIFEDSSSGTWVSNPPFGARVGGPDLRALYQTMGRRFEALGPGWQLGLLVSEAKLALSTGVELKSRALLDHGGLKVRLFVGPDAA